jgi:glycosyltransferase involved in cell wall biosynthesis
MHLDRKDKKPTWVISMIDSQSYSDTTRWQVTSSDALLDTVTILNDCAYVGYEIAEELRLRGYDVLYLPRERGLYSKTMGALFNLLRSKGVLHMNYALQDAYLAGKLKGSFLLHAHGSDLRWTIAGRWGWIVRSSLKIATKVIVATPDLLQTAREYRADAEHLPNPVDTERFAPQPREKAGPKTALYFPKWYETLPEELMKELRKAGFVLSAPTGLVKFEDMPQYLKCS